MIGDSQIEFAFVKSNSELKNERFLKLGPKGCFFIDEKYVYYQDKTGI